MKEGEDKSITGNIFEEHYIFPKLKPILWYVHNVAHKNEKKYTLVARQYDTFFNETIL